MAQPVYPTLSQNPENESYTREPAFDPTVRTRYEDGNAMVMATQTKVPLVWRFVYRDLPEADMNTLLAFWSGSAHYGAVVVKFRDPTNSTDYFVRFTAQPACTLEEQTGLNAWRVEVNLLQALGSYT